MKYNTAHITWDTWFFRHISKCLSLIALKFIPKVDHNPPISHTKFHADIFNTSRVIDYIITYPVHGTWDTFISLREFDKNTSEKAFIE